MFYMSIPYLNLDCIYDSGQVLTWKKIGDHGKYIIMHEDKIVQVEQKRDHFTFSCTEDDFYDTWYEYFDIGTDYLKLHYLYMGLDEDLDAMCNRASGIRVIRQSFLQSAITGMLCDYYSPELSKVYIKNIINACGKKRKSSVVGNVVQWHEFPTAQDILRRHGYFSSSDVGNRKQDILELCKDTVDGLFLDLGIMEYWDMSELLKCLDYINCSKNVDSVSDTICLYGRHDMCAFPIDTNLDLFIQNKFDICSQDFRDCFIYDREHVMNAGYLSQVLKYNYRHPPRKIVKR